MKIILLLLLAQLSVHSVMSSCGCRKPKADVGDVIVEGCMKKTCTKGRWRTKWRSSPAWEHCCSVNGTLSPPGSVMTTIYQDGCAIATMRCVEGPATVLDINPECCGEEGETPIPITATTTITSTPTTTTTSTTIMTRTTTTTTTTTATTTTTTPTKTPPPPGSKLLAGVEFCTSGCGGCTSEGVLLEMTGRRPKNFPVSCTLDNTTITDFIGNSVFNSNANGFQTCIDEPLDGETSSLKVTWKGTGTWYPSKICLTWTTPFPAWSCEFPSGTALTNGQSADGINCDWQSTTNCSISCSTILF